MSTTSQIASIQIEEYKPTRLLGNQDGRLHRQLLQAGANPHALSIPAKNKSMYDEVAGRQLTSLDLVRAHQGSSGIKRFDEEFRKIGMETKYKNSSYEGRYYILFSPNDIIPGAGTNRLLLIPKSREGTQVDL